MLNNKEGVLQQILVNIVETHPEILAENAFGQITDAAVELAACLLDCEPVEVTHEKFMDCYREAVQWYG